MTDIKTGTFEDVTGTKIERVLKLHNAGRYATIVIYAYGHGLKEPIFLQNFNFDYLEMDHNRISVYLNNTHINTIFMDVYEKVIIV